MNYKKIWTYISFGLFIIYTLWWLWLALFISPENDIRNGYSLTYGLLAGVGGIVGFVAASKWGGFKSYVGKSLIFFGFGLLCQFLGQNTYSIQFMIDHIENAYPGFGEIFFFSSIPAYILGVWYIAKAAGSGIRFKQTFYKVISLVFPLAMVVWSYYMFINGTSMEDQTAIAVILNFAYPIGQAIFVSMALMAYFLSGNVLGGVMRRRVIFILFALVFQYFADSLFLYKTINGEFYHADFTEFLFAVSYSIMTFAFLDFYTVLNKLKGKTE